MNLEADAITAIWTALTSEIPRLPRPTFRADAQIVAKGWLSRAELEDYVIMHDSRLGAANIPYPADFAKALGLPPRIAYPRPDHPNGDNFGFESLSTIDVAYLCIWFERLGFQTNVSNLCDRLRSSAVKTEYLSDQETAILLFDATRHRLPPITLTSPEFSIQTTTVKRAKTPTGYGLKYARDKDGKAQWLECRAPKYRKRPDPKSVTCPQ